MCPQSAICDSFYLQSREGDVALNVVCSLAAYMEEIYKNDEMW